MGRPPDLAPPGLFTLGDVARLTGLDRRRITFWCTPWGADLVKPSVNPRTKGATKLLTERELTMVAAIPKLLEAGLDHEQIAGLFKKAQPAWWDLTKAREQNPAFLDWIVLIRDLHSRVTWHLIASAYEPTGKVGPGALSGLGEVLNQFIERHGAIRGFTTLDLSALKREILERLP